MPPLWKLWQMKKKGLINSISKREACVTDCAARWARPYSLQGWGLGTPLPGQHAVSARPQMAAEPHLGTQKHTKRPSVSHLNSNWSKWTFLVEYFHKHKNILELNYIYSQNSNAEGKNFQFSILKTTHMENHLWS